MKTITLIKPDDWHVHLREGLYLKRTVSDTVKRFQRALVMPNLSTPLTEVGQVLTYREQILNQVPESSSFEPILSLYLTEQTTPAHIMQAAHTPCIRACKLYPMAVTTHSEQGVKNLQTLFPVFEAMQKAGLLLLMHGESARPDLDIFDREKYFLDQELSLIQQHFPALKMVLEHISTREAVQYVQDSSLNLAATITAHHLLYNRNDLLKGGVHPHYYCLPILKREGDRQTLIQAATSGHPRFFLGTDSAPHAQARKENACGCAGIYTAHAAIELYAEVFAAHHALDKLENFASVFGAQFYDLPLNTQRITLLQKDWQVPGHLSFGPEQLIPLRAGETIHWSIADV
jgi:dihydroorotase